MNEFSRKWTHVGKVLIVVWALVAGTQAFLPFQGPKWTPRYNMNASTITMACNASGWYPFLHVDTLEPRFLSDLIKSLNSTCCLLLAARLPPCLLCKGSSHVFDRFNASLGAQFGIVSYDWSNAKAQWAVARPMDCDDRLVSQAIATKAVNPSARVCTKPRDAFPFGGSY